MKIKVRERLDESNVELQFITEKEQMAPLLGYIRHTLDEGYLDNYFQGKELEKYLNRHRPIGS